MSISQNNQVEDLKTYIVEVAYPDYLFVKVVATSEEDALELVEYSSDINEVPETYIEGATEVGIADSDAEVGVVKSSLYRGGVS
ncbi:hypothetical protein OAT47_01190 [Gammaproteobacteria bacterium]|nr:hypothetical protein [Gammaproteobacteria bacterium]